MNSPLPPILLMLSQRHRQDNISLISGRLSSAVKNVPTARYSFSTVYIDGQHSPLYYAPTLFCGTAEDLSAKTPNVRSQGGAEKWARWRLCPPRRWHRLGAEDASISLLRGIRLSSLRKELSLPLPRLNSNLTTKSSARNLTAADAKISHGLLRDPR